MNLDDPIWTFMEFQSVTGRKALTDWVSKKIEVDAADDFHDLLNFLQNLPRDLWTRPQYAPFDSEIGELRWKSGSKQHRVFGFFRIEKSQYVLLIGSTKKDKVFDPNKAEKTARERREDILRGTNKAVKYLWK